MLRGDKNRKQMLICFNCQNVFIWTTFLFLSRPESQLLWSTLKNKTAVGSFTQCQLCHVYVLNEEEDCCGVCHSLLLLRPKGWKLAQSSPSGAMSFTAEETMLLDASNVVVLALLARGFPRRPSCSPVQFVRQERIRDGLVRRVRTHDLISTSKMSSVRFREPMLWNCSSRCSR